jgi:hypothetical protein
VGYKEHLLVANGSRQNIWQRLDPLESAFVSDLDWTDKEMVLLLLSKA